MKKSDRIERYVDSLSGGLPAGIDPCYSGYFDCFNRREYYEAHDVLEHLWLKGAGDDGPFFKGLIQLAGGFVHLEKHYLRPHHHKYGRRLAPAARLFDLAAANIAPYAPGHLHLDVSATLDLCTRTALALRAGGFTENPWRPESAPRLELEV